LPIRLKLTDCQAHDRRSTADTFGNIGEGEVLLADCAHDADTLGIELAARRVWANIRPMSNRKRHPAFSAFLYRCPHVERFFNKVKQFRAVATRYDKRDDNFLTCAQLPSILIWLRHDKSVT